MKKIGLILSAAAVVLFVGDGSAMDKGGVKSNSAAGKHVFKMKVIGKEEAHRLSQMHHKAPGATVWQSQVTKIKMEEKERTKKLETLESKLAAHKQEINTLKHENEALKHENAAIEAQMAELLEPQQASTSN